MKYSDEAKQVAKEYLLKQIKTGQSIYVDLISVSRSGSFRWIKVMNVKDNVLVNISHSVAVLLNLRCENGSVGISGGGMDMGGLIVYELSHVLFKDNFYCNGKDCNSNDHFNGDKNYKKHKHSDAGYALKSIWI